MRFGLDRFLAMNWSGRLGFLGLLLLLGVGGFVWVARTGNTAPSQCGSCHPEMTDLWRASLVHPSGEVTCHECHAAHPELPDSPNILGYLRDSFIPEKFLSSAERVGPRCLGCHARIPSADKEEKPFIKINHKLHLAPNLLVEGVEVTLVCLDCHASVAHDTGEAGTNRPLMAGCFAARCHERDRTAERCLLCHYQKLVEVEAGNPPSTPPASAPVEGAPGR